MHSSLLSLRRWQIAGPLAFVLITLAIALIYWPTHAATLGPAGMFVGMGTAGWIMWARSVDLAPHERKAWRVMALGLLSAATGVLLTATLVTFGVSVPAFGPMDIFFITTYVLLVAAICLLARAEAVGRDWVATLLDASVGGIALIALVWTSIEARLMENIDRVPGWELGIALTYPFIDIIAIVALMILVLRRSTFRLDIRLLFVALTLGFQFAADLSYLEAGLGQTFAQSEPFYPFFVMSAACSVLASAVVDRTPLLREYPERSTPLLIVMWPYLLVLALLVTHVIRFHSLVDEGTRAIGLDALVIIFVLVLFRQVIVFQGHRTQIEDQRSQLVASVSHELRTPLTAIVGYLALLEDDDEDSIPDDLKDEMLSDVSGQAKHMARLVSDMMLLAKGSDRRVPLKIEQTTVSGLVKETLASLPGAQVSVQLPHDSVVRIDSDRIQQALINMITNAQKYGGGEILLRVFVRHERTLVIEVHDDGEGVPTRYENQIWERFERGARRLDSTTPGMGIGLAILRAVAESHGGSANYRRSELLGGACFSLLIPGAVVARQVKLTEPGRPALSRRDR
ncbi:MAG: HAMP domain-containing histidine kinase [Acidimicrobiales bacterium]|nr:HAMP domain-containing histidine kinase [Acidimicrobiales bacterium]HLV90162.1 HAMP domain-containing sensor histidine kinase [Acidimicrobiia bacterium]